MQDLAFGRLRVSKIHHFIQQLVKNDKVVADRLFFQLLKVLLQHGSKLVQKQEDLGRVGVAPRQSKHLLSERLDSTRTIQVVMAHMHIIHTLRAHARLNGACSMLLFDFEHKREEAIQR